VQPRPTTPPPAWRPPTYAPPAWRPSTYAPPPRPPGTTRPPGPPVKGLVNRPPAGPPPRRRRHRGRKFLLFTLFTVACCCGIPAYFAWPATQQYPVSAILPASVADLNLRDDNASRRAADQLSQQLRDSKLAGQKVFAGVYADGNGKRVTIFGTTGLRLNPQQDVKAELDYLTIDYKLTEIASYDLGESGVHERCGIGRSGGAGVVVCAWADHGSLATVLLTRRNVTESAALVGVLRSAVLTRG
jgi:hypothetical protein